jgi:hypothetical protein
MIYVLYERAVEHNMVVGSLMADSYLCLLDYVEECPISVWAVVKDALGELGPNVPAGDYLLASSQVSEIRLAVCQRVIVGGCASFRVSFVDNEHGQPGHHMPPHQPPHPPHPPHPPYGQGPGGISPFSLN